MSKRLIALSIAAICGPLAASDLRDNVGVGLGTMIFEGNNGLVSQVSAATTNGSLGNQTFAITSGTSGAKDYKGFVDNVPMRNFLRDNLDAVARDMAAGKGEALDTLIELMAVPEDKRAYTAQSLQSNFTRIYAKSDVTHDEVLQNLERYAPKV